MGWRKTGTVLGNKAKKLKKCSVLIKAEAVCGFHNLFTSQRVGSSPAGR